MYMRVLKIYGFHMRIHKRMCNVIYALGKRRFSYRHYLNGHMR